MYDLFLVSIAHHVQERIRLKPEIINGTKMVRALTKNRSEKRKEKRRKEGSDMQEYIVINSI